VAQRHGDHQFTYFQQVGGLDCRPVSGEITYGLERLAMYLQGVESIFDLVWTDGPAGRVTYGDVFHQNEVEQSKPTILITPNAACCCGISTSTRQACNDLLAAKLPLPAYEQVLKASHTFNLLDARRAISVTERARFILRVRTLARAVAQAYYASREALGFPDAARRRRAANVAASMEGRWPMDMARACAIRRQPRARQAASSGATCWSSSAPRNCRPRRCARSSWRSPKACARA
jgi:hypothetical protein